jgi:hypothetical protein
VKKAASLRTAQMRILNSMRTGRNYPILLALAVSLAAYAPRRASAQARSAQAPTAAQTLRDYETESSALKAPVSEEELQKFATDLITLVRALHDVGTGYRNAGPWHRRAEAGRPLNASQTNTLTLANYGPSVPSRLLLFLGAATPIPSDTGTDYGLFVALGVAKAAQIPLNFLCTEITVILGEGTNFPECIIAAIDQAIAFALQTTLQVMKFCDGNVPASENDAAYFNTIAIFNNLGSDTSLTFTGMFGTGNPSTGGLTHSTSAYLTIK